MEHTQELNLVDLTINADEIESAELKELQNCLFTISITEDNSILHDEQPKKAPVKLTKNKRKTFEAEESSFERPVKTKVDQSKQLQLQYRDLFIDETEYFNLRGKAQPSFVDLIRIEIFDKMMILKRELTAERIKSADLAEETRRLEMEVANLRSKQENDRFINDSKNQTNEEKIRRLISENEDLKRRVSEAEERWLDNKPKITRYEEISDKFLKLQKEQERLMNAVESQTSVVDTLREEKSRFEATKQKLESQIDILQSDKNYLARDNLNLSEKLKLSDELREELRQELKETKKTSQSNFEKLLDKSSVVESEYQLRLKSDLSEMKQKYKEDWEMLKRNNEEITDRKTAFLQDQVTELKAKLKVEEADCLEKKKTIDFLHESLRKCEVSLNEEVAMLKIKLKVKMDDVDRLEHNSEEANKLITIFKTENEADKEKLNFLRNEMIKKEAKMSEEMSTLRAQLIIAQEKIRSYDEVENELDKVIYDSALEQLIYK